MKNTHLLRCASFFGIAAYEKIRLTSQDSRALHLSFFEQPLKLRFFISAKSFDLAASKHDERLKGRVEKTRPN